ncbi:MAG TPA: YraN family protein [Chitinophagaceae bacterium]|nr:YraN family protein [Chitinophagaceae bacterium]
MASHNDLGRYGEELGRSFLREQGFEILHVNWKYSFFEIDIIASKDNVLHFIEVKTRRTAQFGMPEESVDRKKMKKLMTAAEEYLYRYPWWKRVQYDILSILITKEQPAEYFFIEDVYI